METAIILIQCPDQKGIVAKISTFIFHHEANIVQADQYSTDPEDGRFFMRLEFYFDPESLSRENLEKGFDVLAQSLNATWDIFYKSRPLRMGILVSNHDHCLYDLLYRWRSGEMMVNIPMVISNHGHIRELVGQYGIDFHHIPVAGYNKKEKEQDILNLVKDTTDFLVLARYMQILSPRFLTSYNKDIINIHHSFLPSFKGTNPYRQAHHRGVKVIGATAHYVTANLDEGPIIEQVVERVTHKDNIDSLKRKGKNLEKLALSNAIHAHIESRVIRYLGKTIVFE